MLIETTGTQSLVTLEDYPDLLKIRALPDYRFVGADQVQVDTADLELLGQTVDVDREQVTFSDHLFDYQRWIVQRALERERFAIFALTGTGKTAMQLEWARLVPGRRKLIVAPLAVCRQTIAEDSKFYGDTLPIADLTARADLDHWLATGDGIGITNYEKLDGATESWPVDAVVLDESSMLKGQGRRKQGIVTALRHCRYKLCCSATPAPNDRSEFAHHAHFLGLVRSQNEYLAAYFVNRERNDGGSMWDFKPHAFDAWIRNLASWAVFLRDPARWGFDSDYQVPELVETFEAVDLTEPQRARARTHERSEQSSLFGATPGGITSRTKLAQISNGFEIVDDTVERFPSMKPETVARIVNDDHPDESVIVWIKYREEGDHLAGLIPDATLLHGGVSRTVRDETIEQFAAGNGPRVLIAMQSMFSHGLNLQTCGVQVFSTQDDSFERRFQSIRRSLRFGRTEPVTVHTPLTELDKAACDNTLAKADVFEHDSQLLESSMIGETTRMETSKAQNPEPAVCYDATIHDDWTLIHGDSIAHMPTMPDGSIDLAVFSPPFASLFVYSSELGDMGNNKGDEEFRLQWQWFAERLLPKMAPGRIVAVHCADVPAPKTMTGREFAYLSDFPSQLREGMSDAGFLYTGRVTIDKDPQAQAIRTKSNALLFTQLKRNSLNSRPALADYLLLFRAPGEPLVTVTPDITNDQWIEWARPIWFGIKESDTLNTAAAKETDDEKHICPLQIGLIDRCVRLWTNPGELVFSPFAGIGSEGWSAIGHGRRFYGVELKESYYRTAVDNLTRRERQTSTGNLFDHAEDAAS